MELCETCTKRNCRHSIVAINEDNLTTIKCLDYEKDQDKIQGYKKPIERTAEYQRTVMGLYSSSWD